jgi:DNA-binding transcriptional ArsR family regulator
MAMLVSSTIVAVRGEFFRELAQPVRLAILEALREGPLLISSLLLVTGLEQPVVINELDWLCNHALVTVKQRRRSVYYYLSDTRVSLLLHLADELSFEMAKGVVAETKVSLSTTSN